jgi:hypothetical protein
MTDPHPATLRAPPGAPKGPDILRYNVKAAAK